MTRRLATAIAAAASFLISFIVYLRTLAPTVAFIDSGELALAAARRGIPHPPGFPSWVMLTGLFTGLPFGSVAWRANLASAFYASAAAALIALCVAELLQLRRKDEQPLTILIASLFGGLLLAFARTVWAYATITEVYTLNLALSLAIVAALLHWKRVARERWLYVAAALFGVAMGVHLVTIVLLLPAIALLVLGTRVTARQFASCFLIAVATTALVYAYEPLASAKKPPLDWGGTHDRQGFIDHVTAKQYRRDITGGKAGQQFGIVRAQLGRELGPLGLAIIAALIGALLLRRDRLLLGFLLLVIAANIAWILAYPIVDDQDAYALPTIFAIAILASVAVAEAARRWRAVAALALVVPIVACAMSYAVRDRSEYWVAQRLVENTLKPVRPRGLVLSNLWDFISPYTFLRHVENVRPDVEVITVGMLQWPWYLDQLERQHPELMRSVANELAAFRPWAARWVATPDAEWRTRADWQSEYRLRYNALILAMVARAKEQGRSVYATRDFVVREEGDDLYASVANLEKTYMVVPQGIVSEYIERGAIPDLDPLQFDLRGIDDSAIAYEANVNDPLERAVELYTRAYRMHGRFAFVMTRQPDVANASYAAAKALQPDNVAIERERAKFEGVYAGVN